MSNETKKENKQKLGIDIPKYAFVHCPAQGFKLWQIIKCSSCKHFGGLSTLLETMHGKKKMPFESQYRLVCSHIVNREILKLDISED